MAARPSAPPTQDGAWVRVQAQPPPEPQTVVFERPQARQFQRKAKGDGNTKCIHLNPESDVYLNIETLAVVQRNSGHKASEILTQHELGKELKSETGNPRHKFNACIQVQSSNPRNCLNHMGLSSLFAIVHDSWKKTHAKLLDEQEKTATNFVIRLIQDNEINQDLHFRRLAKINSRQDSSMAPSDRIPKRSKRQKAQAKGKGKAKRPKSPTSSLSGDDNVDDDDFLSADDTSSKGGNEDGDDDDNSDVEVIATPAPKPKAKTTSKPATKTGVPTPPVRKSLDADLRKAAAKRAANRKTYEALLQTEWGKCKTLLMNLTVQGITSFPAHSVFNNSVPDSYRQLFWTAHLTKIDADTDPDQSIITLKARKLRRLALILDGKYPAWVSADVNEQTMEEDMVLTHFQPLLQTLCERVRALPPFDSAAVAPGTSDSDDDKDAPNTTGTES